ncbi:ribosomal subunit interface protein [Xanthomonas citri pv. mangiferaeindicae LMG 941]|nr:ribosomal subunit interface protein [Xanthomonas citri pv. mangiferaeindicae LMG 941]
MASKLQRLQRHFDQHCEVRTQLAVRKPDHHVVATVNLPGRTLHADASGSTMYAAIDLLVDKLDRLVLKHKEKKCNHHAREVRDNPA